MNQKMPKLIKVCVIFYFILLALFVCHILFFTDVKNFVRVGRAGEQHNYADGWRIDSGEEVDVRDIGAGDFGGHFRISKRLPDHMEETDALYFSTSNLKFKVYVDDDIIYSYDTVETMTGRGDGISYHMIGLGTKDQNHTVVLECETVFSDGRGGHINQIHFGSEEQFRYYTINRNAFGIVMSALMIISGVVLIIFFFGMAKKNPIIRSAWALGMAAILLGIWNLCDTGIPQLSTGITYASRDIVYVLLHLAGFPIIFFVSFISQVRRRLFVYLSFLTSLLSFSGILIARYVFGVDMHNMVAAIYLSYATQLVLMILTLVDNEIYCRKKHISSKLHFFYIGAALFVTMSAVDMIRYMLNKRSSAGHGSWFRFGIVMFFVFMAIQVFSWWSKEKTSLERDRFINRLLQYATGADDPDTKINKVLEYLCSELHADRAYIFEDMLDGTFDNTYEFCRKGVTPEIENLKGIPYDGVVDGWYHAYEQGEHVLINDIEKYREISENMYNVLKPQGIRTLVTGPLVLEGKIIGFFGVDNPPEESMEEISEIIRLLMYFISAMLYERDQRKRLIDYSYHDGLTGVGNRRAMKEFEKNLLDTSKSYGIVMCDINGLKIVNDTEGHDAGDELIKNVSKCISRTFGRRNVYRLGGDEFAVYVYEDDREAFLNKVENLRDLFSERKLQVSVGISYAEGGDHDYGAHFKEADNRMYNEKRKFYSGKKDRRHSE